MSDHLAELPAPAMTSAAYCRRREHLLAELQRPQQRRVRPVVLVIAVIALAVLVLAPVGGASLAHRAVTGLGDLWSSPAPPPKDPAEVQSFAEDVPNVPPGVTNQAGTPLPGEARDLLSGLGTAGDAITAFPTTNGEVCYMVMGAGSCGFVNNRDPVGAGITFSILWTRITGTTRLYGIASDKVASVDVVIAGSAHSATFKNNAFYYQLPQGVSSSDIQQVVATWKDGSVHLFPWHR